uniref:Uncharacterized protein n=1 Tax=Sinocyclocheilus rhinocerous TaxID=307959 RepID=A0A673JF63_9TELE
QFVLATASPRPPAHGIVLVRSQLAPPGSAGAHDGYLGQLERRPAAFGVLPQPRGVHLPLCQTVEPGQGALFALIQTGPAPDGVRL